MKRVICVSQSESTIEDDTIPAREHAVNKTETDVVTRRHAFVKNVFSRRCGDAKLAATMTDGRFTFSVATLVTRPIYPVGYS